MVASTAISRYDTLGSEPRFSVRFDGLHEPAIFEYCVVTRPTRRAYGGINEEVERVHESNGQNRGPALVIAVVDRRVLVVGPIYGT